MCITTAEMGRHVCITNRPLLPLLASSLLEDLSSASRMTGRVATVRLGSVHEALEEDVSSASSPFSVEDTVVLFVSSQTATLSDNSSGVQTAAGLLTTRSAKPGHSGRRADCSRLRSTSVAADASPGAESAEEQSQQTAAARCDFAVVPPNADDDNDDNDATSSTSEQRQHCLLYTSPSPRDRQKSRMPSSA